MAPPEVYYHFLAAQACMSQQNWDCARNEFEAALAHDNSSSYLQLQLSELYALSGNFEKSAVCAEKAAEIDPGSIDACNLLARIYVELNRTDDAMKQYERILSLDPADDEAYFTLAMLQQQQQRHDDAIATLKKLLKVKPRSETAWFFMGNIYMDIGKTGKARSFYLKALDIDPAFEPALINLALQYEAAGDIQKAIETLKKALEKKLPREIIYRKKKGFGIPLTKWLRYDLRPMLEDLFSVDRMKSEGLFNVAYLRTLMNEHFDGRRDNRKQLWTLLMFEQWRNRYLQ